VCVCSWIGGRIESGVREWREIFVYSLRVLSRTESREMRGDMNTLQVTLNTIKCIVLKTKVDTMWFKSFSTITR
jgi:hypothetical protein